MVIHSLASSATPPSAPTGAGGALSPTEAAAQADSYLGYLAMLYGAYDSETDPTKKNQLYVEIGRIQLILKALQAEITDPTVSQLIANGLYLAPTDYINWWKSGACTTAYNWLKTEDTSGAYKIDHNSSPDTYFAYVMFMISTESQELWGGVGQKQPGIGTDFDNFLNNNPYGEHNDTRVAAFLSDYVANMQAVSGDTLSTLFTDSLNLNGGITSPMQVIGEYFTGGANGELKNAGGYWGNWVAKNKPDSDCKIWMGILDSIDISDPFFQKN